MAETQEKEPQAGAVNKAAQPDQQPVVLNRRSSRMWAIVVSSLVLGVSGAVAISTLPEFNIAWPEFNIALPNFSSIAELFPPATASAPLPDPITVALRDIQSSQQRNADTLQENGTVLQQNTAMLQQGVSNQESLRQGLTAQQTNLKTISNQLSSLIARVDSLQNAVTPLTTSSIPQPDARGRLVRTSRKKTLRLPNKPVGPVSVGGVPLNPAPGRGFGAG